MPVRIGSPGPSTLSALALGIPCSETTDSAQFWVLPFISSSLVRLWKCQKHRTNCGGTFVSHFEQKSPHPFLLKNKALASRNTRSVATTLYVPNTCVFADDPPAFLARRS